MEGEPFSSRHRPSRFKNPDQGDKVNCEEARELLIDDLDGALPAERAASLAAHAAGCAECRAERDAHREAEAAVRALPRVRAPEGFLAGVNAGIDAEDLASAGSGAPSRGHERAASVAAAAPA